MDEQEVVKIVGERLQVMLAHLEQECYSKVKDIDSEILKIVQKVRFLTQRINTLPKLNPFLEFLYSEFFIFLVVLGGGILIWQGLWIPTVITAIIATALRIALSSNSFSQVIIERKKLESEKAGQLGKLESLKADKGGLLSELEINKRELKKRAEYVISILEARLQCKNLKTNLAYLVLEEFNRIEAGLSLGIAYTELTGFFTPAKFAVSQFNMSSDYHVCQLLSGHINSVMQLYEYSITAFRNRSEDLVQSFWSAASAEISEIQKILDTEDYMQFLSTRLNLGTDNTRR